MLAVGRTMSTERGLGQLRFVRGDITSLSADTVGAPDLVCCNWTLHQLPDRETALAALREIARIRDEHGCAVWIFDFARLRRGSAMGTFFDVFNPPGFDRIRVDAVASEAAAWTFQELRELMDEAGLSGLERSQARPLGIYQVWWAPPVSNASQPPSWTRPPMSDDAAFWAERTAAGMAKLPPA